MGVTLILIIHFNLALAHHLLYLEADTESGITDFDKERYFEKAVQLYELAYRSHLDHGNLRLAMLVSNNLGQIHRVAGNQTEHELWLHNLLRVFVCVVEWDLVDTVLDQTEFDGLCHNVSPTMLTSICAPAA